LAVVVLVAHQVVMLAQMAQIQHLVHLHLLAVAVVHPVVIRM
jgi:hypothetical protein